MKESFDTLDGKSPANQLRLVVYPIIYKAFFTSHVVVWDFWTINTIKVLVNRFQENESCMMQHLQCVGFAFCAFKGIIRGHFLRIQMSNEGIQGMKWLFHKPWNKFVFSLLKMSFQEPCMTSHFFLSKFLTKSLVQNSPGLSGVFMPASLYIDKL